MRKLLTILLALVLVFSLAACASKEPAPVTEAPTTAAPTTEAPTTQAPTTEAPTTEAPTTEVPTTEPPTTEAPTETEAPSETETPEFDLDNLPHGVYENGEDVIVVIVNTTNDITVTMQMIYEYKDGKLLGVITRWITPSEVYANAIKDNLVANMYDETTYTVDGCIVSVSMSDDYVKSVQVASRAEVLQTLQTVYGN